MVSSEARKQNWRGLLGFTTLMVLAVIVIALIHRGDYTTDGLAAQNMPVVNLLRMNHADWQTLFTVPLRVLGWMPIIILLLAILPLPCVYVAPMLGYTPLISYAFTSGAYSVQTLLLMLPALILYTLGMMIATTSARQVSRVVNTAAWQDADVDLGDIWASVRVYWQSYRRQILPLLGLAVAYAAIVGLVAII
ncbi:hypothetical protein PQ472_00305 [Lacticaseibacillus pabuli]|uniref:Uncharacterized protein n=1 Tax=Lacticaseibacillus pabuli TaxID=3025672 RepID=A0ABY7WSE4_9LACO|nr:hypothetical protein [Lacticaseibacillus sp. KACC 23028]WDF82714.1 hypothetical protein PQ472_00305 [Lacticaseibacillus sp. KACC 23028]